MSDNRERQCREFARLLDIMDRLRVECPWDRKQTWDSLRSNTIEECFELCDAIAAQNKENICEELGDMLLHIVFYSKIASEEGAFDIEDVARKVSDKLVYRHPHVFGDVSVSDADDVSKNWEQLKQKEKNHRKGALSGVPKGLPSLIKAFRMQQKAAGVGFDWNDKQEVWSKVKEEIVEFEAELQKGNSETAVDEFGDILFSLINVARKYGIDPENALERTNRKFMTRFEKMESMAEEKSTSLSDMTLEQMEALWQKSKM